MVRPISTLSSAGYWNKNFTCEERQIYTVNLNANTVIAIGHEMIFLFTVSTKVSSTSWGLTLVDHQAHAIIITTGLRPRLTVQKACTRGLSN